MHWLLHAVHDYTALSSSHAGTFNVLIPQHIAGDYLSKIN